MELQKHPVNLAISPSERKPFQFIRKAAEFVCTVDRITQRAHSERIANKISRLKSNRSVMNQSMK